MQPQELRTMAEVFEKKSAPTMFLSSFAKEKLQVNPVIQLDSRSIKSIFAVDVKKGARHIDFSKFASQDFKPPMFNQKSSINSDELYVRGFGHNEYEENMVNLISMVTERQRDLSETINRSIEKQISDALFTGETVLIDGTKIEFNKKATHDVAVTTGWQSTSGKPLTDIQAMCKVIKEDSKVGGNTFDLILSDEALNPLFTNPQFQSVAEKMNGIDLVDIKFPGMRDEGAIFHGQFSTGPYIVNLWSYPERYEIPTGFGFADEGTEKPYIPEESALLIIRGTRMDRYYVGVQPAPNSPQGVVGYGVAAKLKATKFEPWAYPVTNDGETAVDFGVKSRPLVIPVNIDGTGTLTDVLAV